MRIEIRDCEGCSHVIDSQNPATLGLWFAEMSYQFMSANSQYNQNFLTVWPSTDDERKMIGHSPQIPLSNTLLQELAHVLNSHA